MLRACLSTLLITVCTLAGVVILTGVQSEEGQAATESFRYCESATNTSDLINCTSKQLQEVEAELTTLFDKLALDETDNQLFQEAQKSWITHRDAQCAWQIGKAKSESLGRLEKLTCQRDLTLQRIKHLTAFDPGVEKELEHEPLPASAYTAYPRWMNALAQINADIFWQYGQRTAADLNCDGINEHILAGLNVEKSYAVKADKAEAQFTPQVVIAVAETPTTGRPHVAVFDLPEDCTAPVSFSSSAKKQSDTDAETEAKQCGITVEIRSASCSGWSIQATDQGTYALISPDGLP